MKRILSLSILLIFVSAFQAFPCFSPTDFFATEVVLSKPAASYNLELIRSAANVSFEEGAFIYRSHSDKRVAAILEEVDESGPAELRGLSVRIQIPTKTVVETRISTMVRFELGNVAIGMIDEDFLRSLGYEVDLLEKSPLPENEDVARPATSISLRKDNIYLSIIHQQVEGQDEVEFRADIQDSDTFSNELKAEFKQIVASLGLDEGFLDEVDPEVVKTDLEDLVEAVDILRDDFDFRSAIKTELDWLRTNEIIKNIDEGDVVEISGISEAGHAGWNSRIVYENEKWLPYNETDNPMLFRGVDCGGFDLEKLPWNDETIILPGPSSVGSEGKLATKWGKLKAGL